MIFVNDRPVEFGQYPNGEAVVPKSLLRSDELPTVRLHWEDDADITRLALVRGQLGQEARDVAPRLVIDYMPYSRMDRLQDGHCFSLRYISQLIAAMEWASIWVVEPHSDVTVRELGADAYAVNATTKLLPEVMVRIGFDWAEDYLVLPDAGALKRYAGQAPETFDNCHRVVMRKARDFATGKIKGLEVDHIVTRGVSPISRGMVERKALIIDDLSSRGGTFIEAADILRDVLDFTEVYLLVTHMELAGLSGDLATKLDRVFCTDTMFPPSPVTAPKNFHIFDRKDWL